MAPKAETLFKARVKGWLHTLPAAWHVKVQQVGLRGTPDILACVNGRFVALELKKDAKAKLDPLQLHNLRQIASAGGFAAVVWPENFDAVQAALSSWLPKRKPRGELWTK